MSELYTLGAVVAGIMLGYFVGWNEGRQAREEERALVPDIPYTPPPPPRRMTAEAFLNFDDMREEAEHEQG